MPNSPTTPSSSQMSYEELLKHNTGKLSGMFPSASPVARLSEVGKAARASVDEIQAMGGGAVALGAQALQSLTPDVIEPEAFERAKQWGLETYGENIEEAGKYVPKIARIEDIDLGEEGGMGRFADWAKFHGTKALGTVATMALGGGIGGMLAKQAVKGGVRRAARGALTKKLKKEAGLDLRKPGRQFDEALKKAGKKEAADQITVQRAVRRGQVGGATVGAFGLEGGESFGQLTAPNQEYSRAKKVYDANPNIPMLQRWQNQTLYAPIQNADGSTSTHRMASAEIDGRHIVYPTIQPIDGKLQQLDNNTALQRALQQGDYVAVSSAEEANWFASGGYKAITESGGISPEKALIPSLTVGAINAALELAPWGMAAKYLKLGQVLPKELAKTIKNSKQMSSLAVRVAKGAAAGMGTEGVTEGLQELVQMAGERWAKDEDIFSRLSDDQLSQIANAAAVGALVGGGMGGVVGPLKGSGAVAVIEEADGALKEAIAAAEAEATKANLSFDQREQLIEDAIAENTERTKMQLTQQDAIEFDRRRQAVIHNLRMLRQKAEVEGQIAREEEQVGRVVQPDEGLAEGQQREAALRTGTLRQREIDKEATIEGGEFGEVLPPIPAQQAPGTVGIEAAEGQPSDLDPYAEPVAVTGPAPRALAEAEDIPLYGEDTARRLERNTERAIDQQLRETRREATAETAAEAEAQAASQAWGRGTAESRGKLLGGQNKRFTTREWGELPFSQRGRVIERLRAEPELKRALGETQEGVGTPLESQREAHAA